MNRFTIKKFLLLIWIVIIPLIVKHHLSVNPLVPYFWADQVPYYNDFFIYYKMLAIIAVAIVMGAVLICGIIRKSTRPAAGGSAATISGTAASSSGHSADETPASPILGAKAVSHGPTAVKAPFGFIPVGLLLVYAFAVIISTFMSIDMTSSLFGFPGLCETAFVLLAYITAFFFIRDFISEDGSNIRFIGALISLSAFLVCLICVPQALGLDIYRLIYERAGFDFSFEKGVVYGSFFNPNYAGGYVLLVLPFVILYLVRAVSKKSKPSILLFGALTIGLLISILRADSFTSIVALFVVSLCTVVIIAVKYNKVKPLIPLAALFILIFIIAVFLELNHKPGQYEKPLDISKKDLLHIYTRKDGVYIQYRERKFVVSMPDEHIQIYETDGDKVDVYYLDHGQGFITAHPDDEELHPIRFQETFLFDDVEMGVYGFVMTFEGIEYPFTRYFEGIDGYCYSPIPGYYLVLDESMEGETFEPMRKLSGLFARGYIWSRSIPLLKHTLVIGSGPNTFAFMFPNYDIVDMYNNRGGYGGDYITKPHSLYLQMGIQTGVVSVLCFTALCLYLAAVNLKSFCSKAAGRAMTDRGMSLALSMSIVGFMIFGLCNDSSITTAPMLWTVLAMGAASKADQKAD